MDGCDENNSNKERNEERKKKERIKNGGCLFFFFFRSPLPNNSPLFNFELFISKTTTHSNMLLYLGLLTIVTIDNGAVNERNCNLNVNERKEEEKQTQQKHKSVVRKVLDKVSQCK